MQPKLVSCISGHIWDVVVDLRKDSPMFKRWQAFNLTGDECNQVYVPVGCAHGFLTLEDAVVLYKCGEVFYPSILDMVYVNRSRCLQAIKNPSKLQKRSRRVFKAWQNSSPIHRFFYSVGLSCLCKKKRTDKRWFLTRSSALRLMRLALWWLLLANSLLQLELLACTLGNKADSFSI